MRKVLKFVGIVSAVVIILTLVMGTVAMAGNGPDPICPNPDCPNVDCPNPDCPNDNSYLYGEKGPHGAK